MGLGCDSRLHCIGCRKDHIAYQAPKVCKFVTAETAPAIVAKAREALKPGNKSLRNKTLIKIPLNAVPICKKCRRAKTNTCPVKNAYPCCNGGGKTIVKIKAECPFDYWNKP